MGTYGGPDIVTDGLVLSLDAANKKSYPGSGTTWYDLSGNNYNFTLVNTPAVNNGFFDFSTNEGATLTITGSGVEIPDLLPENESFTVEIAYKFVGVGSREKFIGTGNFGHGGWNLGVGFNTFDQIDFSGYNGQCNDGVNCQYNRGNLTATVTNNTSSFSYYQLVYNYENTTTYLYINGVLIKSQFDATYGTGKNPNGIGNTSNFQIGLNTQGGWSSKKGFCGPVKYYNRALSTSEVLQNYNATKGRFGL